MLNPDQLFNDRYQVLRQIADRGSATVYLARDKDSPAHQFAIKEYKLTNVPADKLPEALKLIQQTCSVLCRLDHPHIEKIYDCLIVDNVPYLVAEYITGETLEQQMRYNPGGLPEAQVTAWGLQLCDALSYLHTLVPPIIFAGLHPERILLMPDGSVMLTDYDITRAINFGIADTRTQVLGTPGFMAPEQFHENVIGPFTDVYSLGMVMLRLAAGFDPAGAPFESPRADALKPGISRRFADAVAKATAQDYRARFQTIEEFAEALRPRNIVPVPIAARSPSKSLLVIGAAVAVLLIALIAIVAIVLPALRRGATPTALPTTPVIVVETVTPEPTAAPAETAAPTAEPTVQATTEAPGAGNGVELANQKNKLYLPVAGYEPSMLVVDANTVVIALSKAVTMTLVRVPAGDFVMGSSLLENPDVKPEHKIYLDDYLIGKYDVTNAQWAAYARDNGITYTIAPGRENDPVVNVTWDDAVGFCKWVTMQTGLPVRLPTEAQWEKAARSTDGRLYPWGSWQIPGNKLINFDSNSHTTSPVGKYSPQSDSPYQIADMAGNVWNWTSSLYKPYPYKADDGRESTQGNGKRVIRGGSFAMPAELVASPIRGAGLPTDHSSDWGFRVSASSPLANKPAAPVIVPQTGPLVLNIDAGASITLVQVRGAEFVMGGLEIDKNAADNEKPEHKVKVDAYAIAKYDVTNAQYAIFAQATGRQWTMPAGKENHPVVNVTWDDATAFCQWAGQVTGRKVSLPTEAQWELAARASLGRLYAWGNQSPDDSLLNYNMKVGATTPVGQYSPAGDAVSGASDMAGNVLQWTSTLARPYPYKADDGREDPNSRMPRVYRGSSFSDNARGSRTSVRAWLPPTFSNQFLGFRVVVLGN